MINKSFEQMKVKREIKRSGKEYEFKRPLKNSFGEPIKPEAFDVDTIVLSGLYHESSSYVKESTGDTTQTRTKKIPMILTLYPDASFVSLNDILVSGNKKYKVTGITDVQEWGLIADISLEVYDYVIQT